MAFAKAPTCREILRGIMELKGFTKHVSPTMWAAPAKSVAVYGRVDTPLGEATLERGPSSTRTPEALANGWEEWVVTLAGTAEARVRDLGSPVFNVCRKRLEAGVEGEFNGSRFSIHTHSSFRRSARIVSFDGLGITFTARGLTLYAHEGDTCIARGGVGRWTTTTHSAAGIISMCLFEWAGMSHFLQTPFFRML
ncbi:hypothetical protein ABZ565_10430 [Streptomyces sp. NPDC016469]|uniref:hypothetical protein n=1 Tax=Streptomyces sp. NPDC016469 TaxID=3157191 RepID=UPI0033E381B5